MNAIEVVIVVVGTLMVAAAMIAVMVRINQSQRRTISAPEGIGGFSRSGRSGLVIRV